MFGKRLFKSRSGEDEDEAKSRVLPQHTVTSSFGKTTSGGEEHASKDGAYSFGQLSPDPIISPTNHRAPISSYARSILREIEDTKKGLDGHFDDVSSMNDSIYFGAGESNPIPGFSSPVRAELHSAMLDNCMSPSVASLLNLNDNDNDTDIQTVATGHAFSTVISPSVRSELRSDMESTISRVVGPIKTENSPSASASEMTEKETPINSPKEKVGSMRRGKGFCARIRRSPLWLRIVFFGSILLFLVAILLAIIGVMVALRDPNAKSKSNASQFSDGNADDFDPSYVPDVPVSPQPEDVQVPTPTEENQDANEVIEVESTAEPTSRPTMAPQVFATASPTEDDRQKNKESRTSTPVASPLQTFTPTPSPLQTFAPALVSQEEAPEAETQETTVYITSGFLPDDLKLQAETLLPKLPGEVDDTFLVHLGDWNDIASVQNCNATIFQNTAEFFATSSVPVYWTVGDNEFNDCPNPTRSLQLWKNTFVGYETQHWQPPPWAILRQGELSREYSEYTENWVFQHGEIVFLTVNLVGSRVHNQAEFDSRLEANLAWIDFTYDFFKQSSSVIVVFAHAGPDNGNPSNQEFFDELLIAIEDDYTDMQFVFVSRGASKMETKKRYDGISNLYTVSVPGPLFPPMKMIFSDGEPEVVEVDWTTL